MDGWCVVQCLPEEPTLAVGPSWAGGKLRATELAKAG